MASTHDRLRRSSRRRERGAAGHHAAGRKRGLQHREDDIETTRLALAQLPCRLRRKVLIRSDCGGTLGLLTWLTTNPRRLHYSIGMTITEDMQAAILNVPRTPEPRPMTATGSSGTAPASRTSPDARSFRLAGRDAGHYPQGAAASRRQPRFTGIDGHRFTAFATDKKRGQLAGLELRPPAHARCEDRIRNVKYTGLRSLPLPGFAHNQMCCEIVALACRLRAWMQMLALTGQGRRWQPKRLQLRLFSAARAPRPQRQAV
jgi:hypothetical protein